MSMVARRALGGESEIKPSKDQRISLEAAIKAFNLGGVYAQNREKITGSIEAGKLADFIVIDQNLFEVDSYQIHRTQVLETVIDGQTVYKQ